MDSLQPHLQKHDKASQTMLLGNVQTKWHAKEKKCSEYIDQNLMIFKKIINSILINKITQRMHCVGMSCKKRSITYPVFMK